MNPERTNRGNPENAIATAERRLEEIHEKKMTVLRQLSDNIDQDELQRTRKDIEQHD
jgi:hypothetical protein